MQTHKYKGKYYSNLLRLLSSQKVNCFGMPAAGVHSTIAFLNCKGL